MKKKKQYTINLDWGMKLQTMKLSLKISGKKIRISIKS